MQNKGCGERHTPPSDETFCKTVIPAVLIRLKTVGFITLLVLCHGIVKS